MTHIVPPLPPNPMEELEKNMRSTAPGTRGKELYELERKQRERDKKEKNKQSHSKRRRETLNRAPKKIGKYLLYVLIIAGIVFGFRALTRLGQNLPPTSQLGHVEISPRSHIMEAPMGEKIQKHMLEHADGEGRPGVIIQYNCKDFECSSDLVAQLTVLVERYPDNVYLAPNRYDGKIILTKEGQREILDEFDEQAIQAFIGGDEGSASGSDTLLVPVPGFEDVPEMTVAPADGVSDGESDPDGNNSDLR